MGYSMVVVLAVRQEGVGTLGHTLFLCSEGGDTECLLFGLFDCHLLLLLGPLVTHFTVKRDLRKTTSRAEPGVQGTSSSERPGSNGRSFRSAVKVVGRALTGKRLEAEALKLRTRLGRRAEVDLTQLDCGYMTSSETYVFRLNLLNNNCGDSEMSTSHTYSIGTTQVVCCTNRNQFAQVACLASALAQLAARPSHRGQRLLWLTRACHFSVLCLLQFRDSSGN